MKKLCLIGSTGAIGRQVLEIVRAYPEKFDLFALAAGRNVDLLEEQVREFRPEYVSVATEDIAMELKKRVRFRKLKILWGEEGLRVLPSLKEVDEVLCAVVGRHGLIPTLSAVRAGKKLSLANKEAIVMAGELIRKECEKSDAIIIPVDSEHNSLFQILEGKNPMHVQKIILTASGGPFLKKSPEELENVSFQEAISHPVWNMGNKISIDSATMMNKCFEIIEARWLFNIDPDRIKVLIHPQSIVHSLVEFIDGVVQAVLYMPDMKVPIFNALNYPARYFLKNIRRLDLSEIGELTFLNVDTKKFPAVGLAYEILKEGGTFPAVMVVANDVAVQAFMKGTIKFTDIMKVIYQTLLEHKNKVVFDVEELNDVIKWAEETAWEIVRRRR